MLGTMGDMDYPTSPRSEAACLRVADSWLSDESRPPGLFSGLFVTEAIKQGDCVCVYTGRTYKTAEALKIQDKGYLMRLGEQCYVDARSWSPRSVDGDGAPCLARYINDCINPAGYNVSFEKMPDSEPFPCAHVIAMRDIDIGEELFVSYGKKYWAGLSVSSIEPYRIPFMELHLKRTSAIEMNRIKNDEFAMASESRNNKPDVKHLAFSGMRMTLVVNFLQKIISFALNSILVSKTNPQIFGVAAVQLELLLSTLLFLSREGVRLAVLKEPTDSVEKRQKFINICWIPALLLLLASSAIICYLYFTSSLGSLVASGNVDDSQSQTQTASILVIFMYVIGAFLECAGEPWINLYQSNLIFSPRLAADTTALCVRSVSTFVTVAILDMGVLGFGISQMIYGATHLLVILANSSVVLFKGDALSISNYMPRVIHTDDEKDGNFLFCVNKRILGVAIVTTGSSLLKHLLTEADKIVLTFTRDSFDQGIFAVSHNYGSLIARIVFSPIEDAARVAFSKLSLSTKPSKEKNNKEAKELLEILDLLQTLVQLVTMIGTILVIFGPNFARLAVFHLLSPQWRCEDTVQTLSAYCLYVFTLGLNGVTEAFVYAVASPSDFSWINNGLIVSSLFYALSIWALNNYSSFGTSGIILSGAVSMLCRIAFSYSFIQRYFADNGIPFVRILSVPSIPLLFATMIVFAICYTSSGWYSTSDKTAMDALKHVSIGASCGVSFLGVIYTTLDKDSAARFLQLIKRKKE